MTSNSNASPEIRKQKAYMYFHQAFHQYGPKILGAHYNPMQDSFQVMITNWTTFSKFLTPSDLGIIKQLSAAQKNTKLSSSEVDAIINSMITLLQHANMPEHVEKFKNLLPNSGNGFSSGLESAAIVGGLMAAGYFGYKLWEGAQSFLGNPSDDANSDSSSSSNSQVQNQQINIHRQNQIQNQNQNQNQNQTQTQTQNQNQILNQPQSQQVPPIEDDDKENPFMCPITLQVMKDPVMTPQGICFEREAIQDWLSKSNQCPVTHTPLSVDQLITCYAMRNAIEEYEKMRQSIKSGPTVPSSSSSSLPSSTPPSSSLSSSSELENSSNQTIPSLPLSPSQIAIEVAPSIQKFVQVWDGARLREEDECFRYPERSKYIIFPASYFYVVSRSTGFVVVENRSTFDVTLRSREREATIWDPLNVGSTPCAEFVLRAGETQGFDFRGWYCIEVSPDTQDRPIDLKITDFAMSGGGKGAWLRMGTTP